MRISHFLLTPFVFISAVELLPRKQDDEGRIFARGGSEETTMPSRWPNRLQQQSHGLQPNGSHSYNQQRLLDKMVLNVHGMITKLPPPFGEFLQCFMSGPACDLLPWGWFQPGMVDSSGTLIGFYPGFPREVAGFDGHRHHLARHRFGVCHLSRKILGPYDCKDLGGTGLTLDNASGSSPPKQQWVLEQQPMTKDEKTHKLPQATQSQNVQIPKHPPNPVAQQGKLPRVEEREPSQKLKGPRRLAPQVTKSEVKVETPKQPPPEPILRPNKRSKSEPDTLAEQPVKKRRRRDWAVDTAEYKPFERETACRPAARTKGLLGLKASGPQCYETPWLWYLLLKEGDEDVSRCLSRFEGDEIDKTQYVGGYCWVLVALLGTGAS